MKKIVFTVLVFVSFSALATEVSLQDKTLACEKLENIIPSERTTGYGMTVSECRERLEFKILDSDIAFKFIEVSGSTVEDLVTVCYVYVQNTFYDVPQIPAYCEFQ